MLEDLVGDLDVGLGEGLEGVLVLRGQRRVNVVPEESEGRTSQGLHLVQFGLEVLDVGRGGVGHVQARGDAVEEGDALLLTGVDQRFELGLFTLVVGIPPHGAVFVVILGGVEISVEAEGLHLAVEVEALAMGPGAVVESLDHTTEESVGVIPRGRGGHVVVGHRGRGVATKAKATDGGRIPEKDT